MGNMLIGYLSVLSGLGIIGDAFKKLFDVIWSGISWLGRQIGKFFQSLFDLLIGFFTVIFDLIAGLLYLLFKIGVLAVKLFQVILGAAQLLWSFIVGLIKTMGQLVFSPIGQSPNNAYGSMIGQVMTQANGALQLTSVAYIMLFIIWLTAAISAIKIISSIRVGGD